jgi:hypothetical protein
MITDLSIKAQGHFLKYIDSDLIVVLSHREEGYYADTAFAFQW